MTEAVIVLSCSLILLSLTTFGVRAFLARSQDGDARGRLREVAAAQVSLASQWGQYSENASDFSALAGTTKVTHQLSTESGLVSAAVGDGGSAGLAVRSGSGRCLYMRLAPALAGGDAIDVTKQVPSSAPCRGAEALPDGEKVTTPVDGPVKVKEL